MCLGNEFSQFSVRLVLIRVQRAETRRGEAVDMIYRTYKIASSGELKIDCRKAARRSIGDDASQFAGF